MKKGVYILASVGIFLFALTIGIVSSVLFCEGSGEFESAQSVVVEEKTKAIMLMIEFEGTEGVVNFVDNMKQRDIPGVLIVTPDFVQENCDVVKSLIEYHDIQIAGLKADIPLWDVDYDEQYEIVKDAKERIFSCTGIEIEVFGSRYFAYDENTVKAAQANGIDYVLARGTTGAKATIYQPEEYDVKIFSVSNVDSQNWGTGSLCDYSYWAREGTPEDFEKEIFAALKYEKISPVSHTYIGGLKQSWNNVYLKFMDEADVEWVDLDTFGQVDTRVPFKSIPDNREVQYETPHPATPLEEEENVSNPCAVEDIIERVSTDVTLEDNEIVIFHNGTGPMCIEALEYFDNMGYEYTEYLNSEEDFYTILDSYQSNFEESEGISQTFGFYPIIFVEDRAFSGFDDEVKDEIDKLME